MSNIQYIYKRILKLYPNTKVFRFFINCIDRFSKRILYSEEKEEKITEFRYVME